jgi:hypothetical protein
MPVNDEFKTSKDASIDLLKRILKEHKDAKVFKDAEKVAASQLQQHYANQIDFIYAGEVDGLADYIQQKDEQIDSIEGLGHEAKQAAKQKYKYDIWKNKKFKNFEGAEISFEPSSNEIGIDDGIQNAQILVDKTNPEIAIIVIGGKRYLYAPKYFGTGENGAVHAAIDVADRANPIVIKMQCGSMIEHLVDGKLEKFFNQVEETNVANENDISKQYKFADVMPLGISAARLQLKDLPSSVLTHIFGDKISEKDLPPLSAVTLYVLVQNEVPGVPLDAFVQSDAYRNMDDAAKLKLALQIINAVESMHKDTKAFYRDVRPENLMVDIEGDNVALVDMGAAARMGAKRLIGITNGYTYPTIMDESIKANPATAKEGDFAAVNVTMTDPMEAYSVRQVFRFMGIERLIPDVMHYLPDVYVPKTDDKTLEELRIALVAKLKSQESVTAERKKSPASISAATASVTAAVVDNEADKRISAARAAALEAKAKAGNITAPAAPLNNRVSVRRAEVPVADRVAAIDAKKGFVPPAASSPFDKPIGGRWKPVVHVPESSKRGNSPPSPPNPKDKGGNKA